MNRRQDFPTSRRESRLTQHEPRPQTRLRSWAFHGPQLLPPKQHFPGSKRLSTDWEAPVLRYVARHHDVNADLRMATRGGLTPRPQVGVETLGLPATDDTPYLDVLLQLDYLALCEVGELLSGHVV